MAKASKTDQNDINISVVIINLDQAFAGFGQLYRDYSYSYSDISNTWHARSGCTGTSRADTGKRRKVVGRVSLFWESTSLSIAHTQ